MTRPKQDPALQPGFVMTRTRHPHATASAGAHQLTLRASAGKD